MLGNRVNELEHRLADPGQAARRARIREQPAAPANEAAERTINDLRNEIAALSDGKSPAFAKLRNEKAALEDQLRLARDERAKPQRDLNAMQQQAESSWATERMENALLRERINDIAAEVAKLAISSKGRIRRSRRCWRAEPAAAATPARPAPSRLRPPMARPRSGPKAAARWPNASGRCSPTPPAPASRAEPEPAGRGVAADRAGFRAAGFRQIGDRRSPLDTPAPHFVNRASAVIRDRRPIAAAVPDRSRAHSSAGERSLHTGEVQGSIPCAPTISTLNSIA